MANAEKKETNIVTMKNVVFMYSSVNRPVEQLNTDNKPPLTDNPLEFHSFEIKILISEDRFKQLKKSFKGAKNLPNAKEYSAEDIADKFGDGVAEALGIDEDTDDEFVLIKFSQSCLVGNAAKRRPSYPIKQIGIKGKVQDVHGNTIDQETDIGNGTKGHFQFRPVDGKNGLYLYPQLVCVTDLVEYVSGGGEEDLDSLGIEDMDEADLDKEAAEAEGGDEFQDPTF